MQQTYQEAINRVFEDEGGYSNDAGDPGGPTNWGITIEDARMYWKPDATASDVKNMPKSVAEDIYIKHYALPLHYNDLPAGVDYAVLDYGINSGISRAAKVLQGIAKVPVDGIIGPITIAAVKKLDPIQTINSIYSERMSFLKGLSTFSRFGKGWTNRCTQGRLLALSMNTKYKTTNVSTPVNHSTTVAVGTAATATAVAAHHFSILPVIVGIGIAVIAVYLAIELYKWRTNVNVA